MTSSGIAEHAVAQLYARETRYFLETHPRSLALAERARASLYGGVPMHWMSDWSTPVPLFVARAQGAHFQDVDGLDYVDFCLGDTASMFGHSPEPVAKAIAAQAANGLATMLPGEDALACGERLAERFGLPFWQVATTATDANRFVLRWARAITGRKVVLLFDGCYHGTVDEAMVRYRDGHTVHRAGLIGQARNLTQHSRVIPFNDLEALERALATNDVAALLCEPAMTNIGMVLPDPGFLDAARALTRQYGSLLVVDETHTLSTGPGGCTRAWNLEPDFLTLGKAIAGGVSCSVYGCTAAMARAMTLVQKHAGEMVHGHGHSGMGTTLSANALAMHSLRANLEEVATPAAYDHMQRLAEYLANGFEALIRQHQLPWSVTRLGARCELQFRSVRPRTGAEAEAAFHDSLQQALHLYLINRGILITPFHNMTLCSPQTSQDDVDRLLDTLSAALTDLLAVDGARVEGH